MCRVLVFAVDSIFGVHGWLLEGFQMPRNYAKTIYHAEYAVNKAFHVNIPQRTPFRGKRKFLIGRDFLRLHPTADDDH